MDATLISSAAASLLAAIDIGKGAVAVRDANRLATVITQMNEQLLNAQQSLFTHSAQLMALQQQYFQATKELAEIKEAIAQRANYTLVSIGNGFVAYRENVRPEPTEAVDPDAAHVEHYVCQVCFDAPGQRKVVLQPLWGGWLGCPVCKTGPAIANAPPEVTARRR